MSSVRETRTSDAAALCGDDSARGQQNVDSKSSSTTPPSSPPMNTREVTRMPSPKRKRSYNDLNEGDKGSAKSSATTVGDVQSSDAQSTFAQSQVTPSATLPPSTPVRTMAPPPLPATYRTSQKSPQSGQGPEKPQKTEIKSIQVKKESTCTSTSSDPDDGRLKPSSDNEPDLLESPKVEEPHERVEDFDWGDLHDRYHQKLQDFREHEQEILGEFNSLCEYFGVWANAIDNHEVDRSFKRLKTQTAYVRHEEEEVEQKRVHYVKVVDAFKSALELLSN